MSKEREKLCQVVSGAKHRVSVKLDDIWWWFMVGGVLALGLAVAALFCAQQIIGLLMSSLPGNLSFKISCEEY